MQILQKIIAFSFGFCPKDLYNINVNKLNNKATTTTMEKKINATYFDNFDINFDDYKEMYQENYGYSDEEMEEEITDDDVWRYIYDCLDMEWEDLETNVTYSKQNDNYCVITGSLGLWVGRRGIEPTTCNNVWDAIRKCANNMDYVIVKQVNGHLEVTGVHHDGRNTFEIHLLNDRGVLAMDRIRYGYGNADLENRTYHKAIQGYLF